MAARRRGANGGGTNRGALTVTEGPTNLGRSPHGVPHKHTDKDRIESKKITLRMKSNARIVEFNIWADNKKTDSNHTLIENIKKVIVADVNDIKDNIEKIDTVSPNNLTNTIHRDIGIVIRIIKYLNSLSKEDLDSLTMEQFIRERERIRDDEIRYDVTGRRRRSKSRKSRRTRRKGASRRRRTRRHRSRKH